MISVCGLFHTRGWSNNLSPFTESTQNEDSQARTSKWRTAKKMKKVLAFRAGLTVGCTEADLRGGGGGGGGGGFGGCNSPLSYMVTPPLLLNSPSPFPAFCIGPEAPDSPPPPLFVVCLKQTAPPPPAFCIGSNPPPPPPPLPLLENPVSAPAVA